MSSFADPTRETIMSRLWRLTRKSTPPYYCYYSLKNILLKPVRKWFSAVVIPTIPFNNLRVQCYRWCGYKIGKNTFIGMRCYLDDMRYDMIEIEDNVIISYGVVRVHKSAWRYRCFKIPLPKN